VDFPPMFGPVITINLNTKKLEVLPPLYDMPQLYFYPNQGYKEKEDPENSIRDME
jgi:hypothetical protein